MANEIVIDYTTGLTIYFHRFLANGNVFLTDAATNEVYGTGGRDADDYDAPMTEVAAGSGHYLGTFDSGGTTIAAGVYQIQVKVQTGANPANSPTDVIIYKGEFYWDGTAEINEYTLESDFDVLISDINVNESAIDVIKSDLTIVDSHLDYVLSDIQSDINSAVSDLKIIDSHLDYVLSDMQSDLNTAVSDINYVISLEQVQNNDWGGGGSGGGSTQGDGTGTNDFGGGTGC